MTYDLQPPTAPVMGVPFASGYQSGRGIQSPTLAAQGERWTEAAQVAATRPTSVLQQLQPSPNGLSGTDASRMLPSGEMLPTRNGQGENAYKTGKTMLMRGMENSYNRPVGRQPG